MQDKNLNSFVASARNVGAEVHSFSQVSEAVDYIRSHTQGTLLLSPCPSLKRVGLSTLLESAKVKFADDEFRRHGVDADAGVTGANFAFAETGSVALESTAEAVRIATTLPEKHFVFLDPRKILGSADDAVPLLEKFHDDMPQAYLAYITGPSRTADIERVLTIGVHGPAELHILLLEGLSEDLMER